MTKYEDDICIYEMIGWALNLEFCETYEVSLGAYLSCQIMANVLIHQPNKNHSLFLSYNNTIKGIVAK